MKIRAPAKINLRLRVVGKRADGYHLLDNIMLPVSLYDEIIIKKGKKIGKKTGLKERLTVACDDPLVPQGRRNLAYKAASLVLNGRGINESVQILSLIHI